MEKPLYTGDGSDMRPVNVSDEWQDIRIRYGGKRVKPILTRSQMLKRLAESWGAPESWVLDQAVKLLYERFEGVEVELDRSRK